mmetsp:Transcript_12414/g.22558  ORF Transcript_12414/g.22558 Transcript_12414/m.22558 type:complete len:419 (+) Transcript_12414:1574-2830(+)
MRHVVPPNTNRLLPLVVVLVHLDGTLRLLRIDVEIFGPLEVLLLLGHTPLLFIHARDGDRIVRRRNTHRIVPLVLMRVHVDGFLWFVGLDELFFGPLEVAFIFERQSELIMDVRKLVLTSLRSDVKGLRKLSVLNRILHGKLSEASLGKEFEPGVASDRNGEVKCSLFVFYHATFLLRDSQSVLPHLLLSVHVHCRLPLLRCQIVLFRSTEVALPLELHAELMMRILEGFLAILGHEIDHLVILSVFLIHVDGEVDFLHLDVKLGRVLEFPPGLELLRVRHVQLLNDVFAQIGQSDRMGLIPQRLLEIHAHRIDVEASLHIVAFGKIEFPLAAVVLGDSFEIGLSKLFVDVVETLHSLLPLLGPNRSVDRLHILTSFNVVGACRIHLILASQIVAPLLLKLHYTGREHSAAEVHSLAK